MTRRPRLRALPGPDDDHRPRGCLCHLGSDRAEHKARESAATSAADDDELSLLRRLDEPARGLITDNPALHLHIRIPFLPTREAFGENPVTFALVAVPVASDGTEADIAPRVQGDEPDTAP